MTVKYSGEGIRDNTDETKVMSFDVSGVTTNTTRTLTMPDKDITLVGEDSSGNVGIGTSSPKSTLQVGDTGIISVGGSFSAHEAVDGDAVFRLFNATQSTSGSTNETCQLYLGWRDGASGMGVAPRIVAGKEGDYTTVANADSYLAFHTSQNNALSEAMRIDSSGNVATPGITLGNGTTYNAANHLDDYEEGTWTPNDDNGNDYGTSAQATYTKIGRLVYFNFDIASTGSTSGSGIGGLPFTSSSSSVSNNWSVYGGFSSSDADLWGHINASTTRINMYVGASAHTLAGRWIGAGCYYTG